ncbi:hypothetical protein CKF54_00450 [Psittacicella hinzii]|uniref:DUF2190 family protein n=1 Tax=Psittacicella hinzii TaxID=2028575 RepID=A0A3A1YBD9_9GAMM|nr:DUF2190 family protein [Psittacicella hinzii]RIY34500.1 hypothetical protein CKF54_00450 [Psittacicella hinzii]
MAHMVRHEGTVTFTATADIANGELVLVGDVVGVASKSYKKNEVATMYTKDVYQVKAKDGDTFNQGDIVYFDATTKSVTKTATNNKKVGYVDIPPEKTGKNRLICVALER